MTASSPTALVEEPNVYPNRSKKQTFITLAALSLSLFLAALDFTIISPALPTISDYFHSTAGYIWVGLAYLLANAASTPLWGKFSDIWGRKAVLLAAVFVFFVGSLLCATAKSIGMLIAGRAVQGSAAGGLVILVNICISDLFGIRERGFYLGLTSVVWALASGIGPVIGGAFAEKASWRWIWWINLPSSGLTFVMLLAFLPKIGRPAAPLLDGLKVVDWLGSLTILGSAVMLLLGLNFGGISFPWGSPKVVCLIVFGAVFVALFILSEARLAKQPVMPLGLFRRRSNAAALLVCFFHGLTYISASYYLPLYFQAVGGVSALNSGLLILPIALTQSLSGILCGILIRKTGQYLGPIWVGMSLLLLGFGLFVDFSTNFSIAKIIIFEIIAGIGIGLCFQSPLIALQSLVESQDIATATATFGFVRNIACSLSIALGGIVFQNGMRKQSNGLIILLGRDLGEKFSAASAGANVNLVATLPVLQRAVVKSAYVASLRDMWILYTCAAGLGLIASFFVGSQVLYVIAQSHSQSPDLELQEGASDMK